MSGASPTGAQPSHQVVTTTSSSGGSSTQSVDQVPTAPFHDFRGAADLTWAQPLGPLTFTTGGHFSNERDYQSRGGHESVALDLFQHRTTLTVGGGKNDDHVFPVGIGGIRVGLTNTASPQFQSSGDQAKTVTDGLVGISQVLTRRWLVSLTGARTHEEGYLTEPYKIISLIVDDPLSATFGAPSPDSALTENRPRTRNRSSVVGSSVYHLADDVLYTSYRYYWDDWGIRSHTVDVRYRTDLPDHDWLQPHLRFYTQTQADFFTFGLPLSMPVSQRPEYATSDFRMGPLHTVTLGLTYGFKPGTAPGDLSVRGEYMRQWGDGHPASAIGVQQQMDLFPSEDVFTVMVGYSLPF